MIGPAAVTAAPITAFTAGAGCLHADCTVGEDRHPVHARTLGAGDLVAEFLCSEDLKEAADHELEVSGL